MIRINILLFVLNAFAMQAQWNLDPAINNLECTGDAIKYDISIIPDGKKGVFAVWADTRNNSIIVGEGSGYDIYAQHIDSNGNNVWDIEGLPVIIEIKHQTKPKIVAGCRKPQIQVGEENYSKPVVIQ